VQDDRVSWCNGVVRTHPSEIKQQRTEAMQSVRVLARRLMPRTSNASTSTARLSTKSGAREEELLARDPALSKYQSTKTTAQRIQLFGDFLVILVAAGAVYEIAYKVQQRNAAEAQDAKKNLESQITVEQR
jgi:hypothetical protein